MKWLRARATFCRCRGSSYPGSFRFAAARVRSARSPRLVVSPRTTQSRSLAKYGRKGCREKLASSAFPTNQNSGVNERCGIIGPSKSGARLRPPLVGGIHEQQVEVDWSRRRVVAVAVVHRALPDTCE